MKKILMNYTILLVILELAFPAELLSQKTGKASQWQRWENHLVSEAGSSSPVSVEIIFSGPRGITFTSPAFTDDNRIFRFRAAFPAAGTWTWKSVCSNISDPGLHNKSGKVKVLKYRGQNTLYIHGDLRVSENRRYLVHADGTPFLWMGETGWNATLKSTMEEWKYYVDKRASQGFSVIQISPRGSGNRNTASASPGISVGKDGKPDPVFWKDLEDKVAYANDKGIYILMVGTGSAWRDLFAQNEGNQDFESYITGRFAAHMTGFSPSFDQLFIEELDKVAVKLQRHTRHLVTQHPGTNYEANLKYRNTAVDFCGLQSGHHGGNLARVFNAARQWTLDMWNGTPVKPVINIEAMYDAYGNNNAKNWREKDARKPGWIAWMSGSRGFTYGCGDVPPKVPSGHGGVWLFNQDTSSYDYWKKAVEWPSARQMTIMKDFFGSFSWWELVPAHELVLNQENDEQLKITASITSDGKILIAYLPGNDNITLDLKNFKEPFNAVWMNPATGEYVPVGTVNELTGIYRLEVPGGWEDAVLKLSR